MRKKTNLSVIDLVLTRQVDLLEESLRVDKEAAINSVDKLGRSALMHAVLGNDIGIAEVLLRRGGNVNMRDKVGLSALHLAAQEQNISMVELLIRHGADVDVVDEHGNTPLFKAVFNYRGADCTIPALLQSGADPRKENNYGVSPLKLAETISNYPVLSFFDRK